MLKVKTIPVLLHIVSKIDITPAVDALKKLDIFKSASAGKDAIKQLDREKAGIVVVEAVGALIPQIGKIADDIPALAASYKGISIEEANELDAAEFINEIIYDGAVVDFVKRAFVKKVK